VLKSDDESFCPITFNDTNFFKTALFEDFPKNNGFRDEVQHYDAVY
jgi:hypothetical protein